MDLWTVLVAPASGFVAAAFKPAPPLCDWPTAEVPSSRQLKRLRNLPSITAQATLARFATELCSPREDPFCSLQPRPRGSIPLIILVSQEASSHPSRQNVAPSPVSPPQSPTLATLRKSLTSLRHVPAISSCAASSPASPSGASATSATASAPCATRTSGRRPSCASATSAASATTRTSASSAAARASRMLSTASNARGSKRTAMVAPRLSTWAVREQMYVVPLRLSCCVCLDVLLT